MLRIRMLAAAAWLILAASTGVTAEPRHGLSAFGDLKYRAGFQHFDYVNPRAPKGGRIVTIGTAGRITFDSLNGYILKGVAAQNLGLLFDTLMVPANDEPDAVYGLVAQSGDVATNRMSVTFKLRPEARFSDGSALTGKDVCKSFDLLKHEGHPSYRVSLRDVSGCQILDDASVRYVFEGKNVRDLPMIVARLPVFSSAYYSENEFNKTSLKPPLGSGPYEILDFKQGNFITYGLRDDYWAKDLPVNRGRYNFGEIKLLYFRDRTAELEALKAGSLDLREEFTSKSWATEYNLPAVRDGRLIKGNLPDHQASGAQGFFINMRKSKFADRRTREALDLAFDFQWTNKNLFYGLYQRTTSMFENSQMKAVGPPDPAEAALLEPFRDEIGEAPFGAPYLPPVSNGSGQDRKLLRRASQLLDAAGWMLKDRHRVNGAGETLSVEFLIFSPTFERIIAPYVRNLKLLGIAASIRQVEAAQYQERLKKFDFDITTQRFTIAATPGTELISFLGSATANVDGSFNLSGLQSQAVDRLIDKITQATSRDELWRAARALDRVVRSKNIWVPHWYKASHNIAYWDIFGMPKIKPRFSRGVFDTWWIDAAKAERIDKGP